MTGDEIDVETIIKETSIQILFNNEMIEIKFENSKVFQKNETSTKLCTSGNRTHNLSFAGLMLYL
jgi:hypothetical protein